MTQPVELDAPLGVAGDIEEELAELLADVADTLTVSEPNSMVRMGNKQLPERTPVYDEDGAVSMVPTAALRYHLTKKKAGTTRRAFYLKPPEGVTKPVPIDDTCEDCTKARRGVPKPFYDEMDLERHRRYFHPMETEVREKKAEKKAAGAGAFLAAVADMDDDEKKALRALLGGTGGRTRANPQEDE